MFIFEMQMLAQISSFLHLLNALEIESMKESYHFAIPTMWEQGKA